MNFALSDYYYELPEELIAQKPASPRDASRMMVLNREKQLFQHNTFKNVADFLPEGAILVVNNSRVIPARIPGKRHTGGSLEALLVQEEGLGLWKCKVKNSSRIKPGEELLFCDGILKAELAQKNSDGTCTLQFSSPENLFKILEENAYAPIPPYILKSRKEELDRKEDLKTYQTIFADKYGAIAAPTAGLHFTPEVLETIRKKNVEILNVTLHVGLGTFEPVRADDIRKHQMHEESYEIPEEVAQKITTAKQEKRPIIAVGTTAARTLESAWRESFLQAGFDSTSIFMYPSYRFKVVDQLLTNFHLPESTLLMLISALAGRDFVMDAYEEAIREKYRFYSYGDCMLIQ